MKISQQENIVKLPGDKSIPTVRLIADVSAVVLKQKLTLEYGLWLRLRAVNYQGSGFIDTERAIERLQLHFGYSRSSAGYQIKKAKGKFLQVKFSPRLQRSTIEIWGLRVVCEYLGITHLTDRHFRDIPATEFTRDRTLSQIYASTTAPDGIQSNPMSRETITERTGLHKVQQRRYEKREHIKRTSDYVFYQDNSPLGQGKYKPLKQEIFTKKKGSRSINKRSPNIYHSKQKPSSKGMLPKVNAKIKRSSKTEEAPTLIKRYFPTLKKLHKALIRRPESEKGGFYLIPNSKRLIRGRLEWCFIDICS